MAAMTPQTVLAMCRERDIKAIDLRFMDFPGIWQHFTIPVSKLDEEVFEDPFAFRSDRKPNRHLAFGYGAHLCLGQYLAKMEMRILFEELLPRLKSVALDGEVKMTQATFVHGPQKLPIRFEVN